MKFALLNRFKPNKTWAVLGAALTVALLAAFGASRYLNHRIAAIEERNRGQMINLIVAKSNLGAGEPLSADKLAVRRVPLDYAPESGIAPEDFDHIDGRALAYAVKSGEVISWSVLEAKKVPTFSARVATGRRALTVPVDEINSISGMLEPGDVIDLMVTLEKDGKKRSFPLLQSVRVLATGQRAPGDPKGGDQQRGYATVTLDMSPHDAQRVIVARENGKITALLRNPDDKQLMTAGQGDLDGLFGDNKRADGSVPVLYGGNNEKFSPEALTMGRRGQPASPASPQPAPIIAPNGQELAAAARQTVPFNTASVSKP